MAWSDPVDATTGQRILSALVDLAFFAVLGVCALYDKLHENAILVLLTVYAQGRFFVAGQKQNAGTISTLMGGPSGPPSGGSMRPPGDGTGTSTPKMAAVTEPIATTPPSPSVPRPARRDDRREYRRAIPSSPIVYLLQQIGRLSRPAIGLGLAIAVVIAYGCTHVPTSHDAPGAPRSLRLGVYADASQDRYSHRSR